MQLQKALTGTAAAIVTPFHEDHSIDFDSLTKIIERGINGGLDYLVVLGSTGEAATLAREEKKAVRDHFVRVNEHRVPLVLGIGGNNTAAVAREIQDTDLSGFQAILSVSPSYNKPSQEGIYRHYAHLAEISPLPIILYNVPGRTGKNIEPETVFRLAKDYENIIGIKEAAGNMEQVLRLISGTPDDFLVISGDDPLSLPLVSAGGAGVISVIAQAYPKAFSRIIRKGLSGAGKENYRPFLEFLPIIDLIFEEGNPTGIKQLLELQDMCSSHVRLPLTPATATLKQKLKAAIQSLPYHE